MRRQDRGPERANAVPVAEGELNEQDFGEGLGGGGEGKGQGDLLPETEGVLVLQGGGGGREGGRAGGLDEVDEGLEEVLEGI